MRGGKIIEPQRRREHRKKIDRVKNLPQRPLLLCGKIVLFALFAMIKNNKIAKSVLCP